MTKDKGQMLIASITFAIIYGIMALQKAFKTPYVVQDDARQHVFWMQRFIDPELFPDDFITDYFQSVAPGGIKPSIKLWQLSVWNLCCSINYCHCCWG
ncbi:hypothetical protein [[Phormidium] sp. ETS-05]|uniref:hypothetical protein n=1 Tax=[Phormidium] sp. ETS-05 TaxID=222819 RepID=UPI0018EEF3DF|nr:hypothetical protein [[Phormidium] sp. ETS-05]